MSSPRVIARLMDFADRPQTAGALESWRNSLRESRSREFITGSLDLVIGDPLSEPNGITHRPVKRP